MTRLPALPAATTVRLEPMPEPLPWTGARRTLVPADPFDPAWATEIERAQPGLDPAEPALPLHLAAAEWEEEAPEPMDDPWFDEGTLATPAREVSELDGWVRQRRRTRLLSRLAAAALAGALVATVALVLTPAAADVAPEPQPAAAQLPSQTALHLPIHRGDTFAALVGDRVDAMALVGAAAPLADLNRIETGRRLVLVEEDGEVVAVRYPVDEARTLVLQRSDDSWGATVE